MWNVAAKQADLGVKNVGNKIPGHIHTHRGKRKVLDGKPTICQLTA